MSDVLLTDLQRRILSVVKHAGYGGISLRDLHGLIYGDGLPPLPRPSVLKAHVWRRW
jgi:hypothetical protein